MYGMDFQRTYFLNALPPSKIRAGKNLEYRNFSLYKIIFKIQL